EGPGCLPCSPRKMSSREESGTVPALGVDDGVVAAGAVGLGRLGGLVVVPAAAVGEITEGEPAARRQGHRGAAAPAGWRQLSMPRTHQTQRCRRDSLPIKPTKPGPPPLPTTQAPGVPVLAVDTDHHHGWAELLDFVIVTFMGP